MSDLRKPIFIIGAARSGTKFLRACLAASNEIDEVPFDVSYVWRYGNETINHDQFSIADIRPNIKKYILETLPNLTVHKSDNSKYYVEKSVSNTLRVEFVNAVFPEAIFVHLIRDGRAVIESSIRQWNSSPEICYIFQKLKYFPWRNYRYAFWFLQNLVNSKINHKKPIWGPRYKEIEQDLKVLKTEEICAKQWAECIAIASKQLSQIDSDRVLTINFESFISEPKQLEILCDALLIKDKDKVIDYYVKNVQKNNNVKSINQLTTTAKNAIEKYAQPILNTLNYH
jgi:hypothetical protein